MKCHFDIGSILWIGYEVAGFFGSTISEWCLPDPDTLLDSFSHTVDASFCSYVVIKFSKTGEHDFHEFAGWSVIYFFRNGTNFGAVIFEFLFDDGIVSLVAGKSIDFVDDKIGNFIFLVGAK